MAENDTQNNQNTSDEAGTEAQGAENGAQEDSDLGEGGKKALEAERNRAKAAERALRAAQRDLEAERTKNLTDSERAIAEAKAAGRSEAVMEAGKRLARAEIRAAASEKGLDVASVLEDLDLGRFVGDDGEPDDRAIARAVTRWAAIAPPSSRPRGDVDQGRRGSTPSPSAGQTFADFIGAQINPR